MISLLYEDKKLLDLDQVSDCIIDKSYRSMFNEAVRCYYNDSYRAAVILTWITTADCLYSRIKELSNDNDQIALDEICKLDNAKGKKEYEEMLISSAQKCELIDKYEYKALIFVKDTRNHCAHPTDFIPSVETVRHIFNISSQFVLCRNGYRGRTYLKNIIEVQFNDRYFLKNELKRKSHCNEIIEKVPRRLWLHYPKIAADYFGSNPSNEWKNNFLIFTSELVSFYDEINKELVVFESKEQLFFHSIVGLTEKTTKSFEEAKRYNAKCDLSNILQTGTIDPYILKSWANILTVEELEENEKILIKKRYPQLVEALLENHPFIEKNRVLLFEISIELLNDRNFNASLEVIPHLLGSSIMCEESEQLSNLIKALFEIDLEILENRKLFDRCIDWDYKAQVVYLENIKCYLDLLSYTDKLSIIPIFEVARNILKVIPQELPEEFEETIYAIITGDVSYDWVVDDNDLYRDFIGQVRILIDRHGQHLSKLNESMLPLVEEEFIGQDNY